VGGNERFFQEQWVLRDISFEVRRGEAVGIVGRNGAGKSTLLEIISGTLSPTEGDSSTDGRIAPLLQLGAGFHPDYSGRENAYLSSLIMGLSRSEVDERFDEIASFADIGHYMESPVQTYSSGMYARLAFAVAMSARPDILIVDEILAVGDLLFQQKCMTRIKQMRDDGLTLLFVSHSTDHVKGLCDRGLLLDSGRQMFFGLAQECTDLYLAQARIETNRQQKATPDTPREESEVVKRQSKGVLRYGDQQVRILDVLVMDESGQPARDFYFGDRILIRVCYSSAIEIDRINVSYLVRDETGVDLTGTMTSDEGVTLPPMKPGDTGEVVFSFSNCLRPGPFGINIAVTQINPEDPRRPLLLDQIDGVEGFVSFPDPNRPVHYKFDSKVDVKIP
jgi:lipopolysaccharide transport system ATP-binding protein